MKSAIYPVLFFLVALVCFEATARCAEFFVAPDGKADALGTRESPWNLATAFAHPAAVKPGDTIWLRGGTYGCGLKCELTGAPDQPIVVRQAPGERATIDLKKVGEKSGTLFVMGDWVRFQDFEVTCSDPKRVTQIVSSWPVDLDRGSIDCRASHVSLVNLNVHDLGVGIGFWSEGESGEIYGCLIYNNGWKAPDRGHGHGIYTQNERGTKRLVDNILFNQFAYGIHAYGSSKAKLAGFHLEGNISFNSGSLSGPEERASNILVGGGTRAERIAVIGNYTYHTNLAGTSTQLGYGGVAGDVTLKDNYLAGFLRMLPWEQVSASGNTFVGLTSLVEVHVASREALKGYDWNRNTYLSGEVQYQPLAVNVTNEGGSENIAAGWQQWQERAGLDRNGTYIKGRPAGTAVFVRPNQYLPGRANVVVYNWDKLPAVEVDLKDVLKPGQAFRIVSAQNFYGEPVLRGRYDGQKLQLTIVPREAVTPIGFSAHELPVTEPEFGAYVVLPE